MHRRATEAQSRQLPVRLYASTAVVVLAVAAALAAVPDVLGADAGGGQIDMVAAAQTLDEHESPSTTTGDRGGDTADPDDAIISSTVRPALSSTTVAPATTAPTPTTSSPSTGLSSSTSAVETILTTTPPSTASTTDPTTASTTASAPSTSTEPTTAPVTDGHTTTGNDNSGLASLANTNPLFSRYSSLPSSALSVEALTEPASAPDNGSVGDGQFRMACQYSHFAYDDPIVFPGRPGASHLHMFFGNTLTSAHTTAASLLDSGGGTCNGFELNRSAYWTPALLDGTGNVVVPTQIILYYKTKLPSEARPFPVGLKMISGSVGSTFSVSDFLFWSCGDSGRAYNKSNHIPDCGGDVINASIVFPECWDGENLDSSDHRSHMRFVNAQDPCPSSHPVRLPQISILLYYPGQPSVDGWHLSADGHHGNDHDGDGPPGGSLHADWFGGWNDEALTLWMDGCIARARNCSYGQTGTDRRFAPLNVRQDYPGPYLLPLP